MRIIAGKAKGRSLKVPRVVSRPTADRVRESLFGMLAAVVEGAEVLDLFAGAGSLGLEALSRGASSCDFVEKDRGACRVIEENLKTTGLAGGRVTPMEVKLFLQALKKNYDLIFADPPYCDGLRDLAGELAEWDDWSEWLNPEGLLVLETEAGSDLRPFGGLEVLKRRRYGRSALTIYQRCG